MKLIDILVRELPNRGGWPEGAIEFFIHSKEFLVGCFYDVNGEEAGEQFDARNMEFEDRGTDKLAISREQYEAALAASKLEWDGEGLPPVGTVCEYMKRSLAVKEWTECTIDYVGSSFIVYRDCYGVELTAIKCDIEFRPIRSEADKKRDIIISKIEKAYKDCQHSDAVPQEIYEAIAEHIRID